MLSPHGGQAFAEALKVNRTLQVLYLHKNSIRDDGAQAQGSPMGLDGEVVGKKGSVWEMF